MVLYISKNITCYPVQKKQWKGLHGVLCCVNMTGSDKRKLLVVEKRLKPRCLKPTSPDQKIKTIASSKILIKMLIALMIMKTLVKTEVILIEHLLDITDINLFYCFFFLTYLL